MPGSIPYTDTPRHQVGRQVLDRITFEVLQVYKDHMTGGLEAGLLEAGASAVHGPAAIK